MSKEVKVGVIIYENCTSSMVTGFWDILTLANQLHKQNYGAPLFNLELIGKDKNPINSFSGLSFTPQKTIRSKCDYDLIYVPGFIGGPDDVIDKEHEIIQWLKII